MNIYNITFYLQHNIEAFTLNSTNRINFLQLIIILLAGIFTGLNPCTISILPIYLSYINNNSNNTSVSIIKFSIGIITSITVIQVVSIVLGKSQVVNSNLLEQVTGILSVTLGLYYLNLLPNIQLKQNRISEVYIKSVFELSPYLNGLVFGISLTSCSTPIIITFSLWIIQNQNIITTIICIIIYTLGYIIPILLISLTIGQLKQLKANSVSNEYFFLCNGFLIITIGTIYTILAFL
jgi:cytochrome c-type biogenesis protein